MRRSFQIGSAIIIIGVIFRIFPIEQLAVITRYIPEGILGNSVGARIIDSEARAIFRRSVKDNNWDIQSQSEENQPINTDQQSGLNITLEKFNSENKNITLSIHDYLKKIDKNENFTEE